MSVNVRKFAAMSFVQGIALGIALGIVLSILALNLFIRAGDFAWLQHLLLFEAAKECVDQENNNKIVEAIRQKGAPGVRLLLEQGEDAQQEINCFGDTPLYAAIFQIQWGNPRPDRFEMLELLIQHGADVNHVNKNATTPLHRATSTINRDEDAVRVVEILLDAGADPLLQPQSEGFLGGFAMWSPYNQALTRGEFGLAALMRARPEHAEPLNVKDLIVRGEESLLEELTRADHPREARRLAEKIRRRMDAGEWVTGKDVLQYLEQIEGRAPDAANQ